MHLISGKYVLQLDRLELRNLKNLFGFFVYAFSFFIFSAELYKSEITNLNLFLAAKFAKYQV